MKISFSEIDPGTSSHQFQFYFSGGWGANAYSIHWETCFFPLDWMTHEIEDATKGFYMKLGVIRKMVKYLHDSGFEEIWFDGDEAVSFVQDLLTFLCPGSTIDTSKDVCFLYRNLIAMLDVVKIPESLQLRG